MPSLAATLAALALLAAPDVAGAADGLDLWIDGGAGLDGNPARVAGAVRSASGFTSLLGRARLREGGEAAQATVTLSEAGRLYPDAGGATALASRLDAAGRLSLGEAWTAGLRGAASDYRERAGALDRQALRGEGSISWRRGGVQLSADGGWSSFAPQPPALRPFRSQGPEGWLRAAWAPLEGHLLSLAGGRSTARFPDWAALGAPGLPRRTDEAQHLAAEWSWRGEVLASAGWTFTANRSGAPGGDFTRHRLAASAALDLPLELSLAIRLALQWTRYPDPLLLAQQQRLAEGQESLDALELRLSRSLSEALEGSLSLAWYRAQGGPGVPGFERAVASLALGWRG